MYVEIYIYKTMNIVQLLASLFTVTLLIFLLISILVEIRIGDLLLRLLYSNFETSKIIYCDKYTFIKLYDKN